MKGSKSKRPRRRAQKSHRSRIIGSLSAALILVAVLLAGIWFAYPHVWRYMCRQEAFQISEVCFTGTRGADEAELRELLPPVEGVNLFMIDLKELKEILLQHPWVKDVALRRLLPSKLVVSITEKSPAALICADRIWALDRAGLLLPLENWRGTLDLPLINCPLQSGIRAGDLVEDSRVLSTLRRLGGLQRRLPELWQMISEISWDSKGQLVFYASCSRTRILLGTDPSWQQMLNFYSFVIYQGCRSGMDDINLVDLRFRGQVIVRRSHGRT